MLSEVLFCIFCEGVRPEIGGKATILGFGGLLPYVTVGVQDKLKKQVDFTLLISTKGDGDVSAEFEILDPNCAVLAEQKAVKIDWDGPEEITNLVLQFPAVKLTSPGLYAVRVAVDGKEIYKSSFQVDFDLSDYPPRSTASARSKSSSVSTPIVSPGASAT
jgi:hypothetical protein